MYPLFGFWFCFAHIIQAFPLFSVSTGTTNPGKLIVTSTIWPLLWLCPRARQLLWRLTDHSSTQRLGTLVDLPPPGSLIRPILSPQNAGATLIHELPRCLDKLSQNKKKYKKKEVMLAPQLKDDAGACVNGALSERTKDVRGSIWSLKRRKRREKESRNRASDTEKTEPTGY